jgi:hypothetical protein
MRLIGKNAKLPLAHGEFFYTFPSLEVGSEWMDGILLGDKQMKLDLDEMWKMNVYFLDERYMPIWIDGLRMNMDVFWSIGCMRSITSNEQK